MQQAAVPTCFAFKRTDFGTDHSGSFHPSGCPRGHAQVESKICHAHTFIFLSSPFSILTSIALLSSLASIHPLSISLPPRSGVHKVALPKLSSHETCPNRPRTPGLFVRSLVLLGYRIPLLVQNPSRFSSSLYHYTRPLSYTMGQAAEMVWGPFEATLRTLYLEKDLSLAEVMHEMVTHYQFNAT